MEAYFKKQLKCGDHKSIKSWRVDEHTYEECRCGAVRQTTVETINGRIEVRQGGWC